MFVSVFTKIRNNLKNKILPKAGNFYFYHIVFNSEEKNNAKVKILNFSNHLPFSKKI